MDTVLIGGKTRPVHIGWGALKEFAKLTDRTFGKVFEIEDLTFDDIESLVYVGLKWGAKSEGEEFDVKKEDISGWFEEDLSAFAAFMAIFQEQLTAATDEKNV